MVLPLQFEAEYGIVFKYDAELRLLCILCRNKAILYDYIERR